MISVPEPQPGRARNPRVVIIGGGFGGLEAARALRTAPVEVVLIDRSNHHVFQPLLYQVATAALPPSDIVAPLRWLLRKQRNAVVLLGEVRRIEPMRKLVHIEFGSERSSLEYDYLIVAAGARHSYFGNIGWEPHAPGLKNLDDAIEIRSRFLLAFERAEWEEDARKRAALQTFVVVGGGPTGVELAGILPEIARRTMKRDFRRLDPSQTRVVLIEAGERLLPAFSAETSERVARDLDELGVEVRTHTAVTDIAGDRVILGDDSIVSGTVFWAAGNEASPLGQTLGAPIDRVGRVLVHPDLSIPGHPEVFVVGDLAVHVQDGRPIPGVAQGAIQGGRAAATNIRLLLAGEETRPFRYRNKGDAATIGRNRAIVEFPRFRLSGRPAWLFWLFLHILYLTGFRNRFNVLFEWAYAYFTYARGSRLIGPEYAGREIPAAPHAGQTPSQQLSQR